MKSRIISALVCICMVIALFPAAAFTGDEPYVDVGGVGLRDGEYLVNGSLTPTKEKPEDHYAYFKDDVLTLKNAVVNGKATDRKIIIGISELNQITI